MNRLAPWVCAISSRRRLAPDARTTRDELTQLDAWIESVLDAQVTLLQIREPDLAARDLLAVVRRAMRCAQGTATTVVVNDRVDVALVGGASGVHLPSRALPPSAVRSLDASWTIGRSVHGADELVGLDSVDYVVFGTVFPSASKPGAPAAGLAGLREVVAGARCPVIGIGGMTPHRARECVGAGAAGVAAIGLFLPEGREPGAWGAARAARALRDAMAGGLSLVE